MIRARLRSLTALVLVSLLVASSTTTGRFASAGEVTLKNGMVLRGIPTDIESLIVGPRKPNTGPVPIYPIVMVSSPLKRYFIPTRQKEVVNRDVDLGKYEAFKILQTKLKGSGRIIGSVQGYLEKPQRFDAFGRRRLLLETASGELPIIQGVTEITPEYLKVVALNATWETAIATSSVPEETLDSMLRQRQVTQQENPDDRLRIARFYIQADRYGPAGRELEAIRHDFPELADTVGQVQITLTQAQAQDILTELKLRRQAGQHQFVYNAALKFPVENVAAPILREVRELAAEYDAARERRERAVALLGDLVGELKHNPRVAEIAPLRAEITEKLNVSNLDRLDACLKLASDGQLAAEEKLALALSGWVVGSANSVTELGAALRMWQARFLVLDYLRTPPDGEVERKAILAKLASLEGVGPERVAQMLPLLPPALEPVDAAAGSAEKVKVAAPAEGPAVAYWVSLPLEYHPDHFYPLIVALHGEQGSPQQELQGFWGGTEDRSGQSQRHGAIVIAPEYLPKSASKGYDYSSESHEIVVSAMRDARKRFSVDSDRVFLAGHGMGADAAWDMGLSHPYLFAGIIPISGAIDRHAKYYLDNGRQLPFYAVNGELDRDLLTRNGTSLMHMMQQNFELIYCEYAGAGPESFFSEIHMLFEWMSKQTRPPPPKQVNVKTLRQTDNGFSWFEFSGLPDNVTGVDLNSDKQ
ncbi:MAG TPA: hypothetical protein VKU82_07855, partial [Planctomycetaceae bacterium]|nr:hypothetical protein [Planctomycetaceae bacterium]